MPIRSKIDLVNFSFELQRLAFVALGSNLGNPAASVLHAMDRLQELTEAPLLRSALWESTPVDCPPGSPKFINAAAGLVPGPLETPESLLERLQALETAAGRRRSGSRNEPRPLDLDLIAFGRETRASEHLALPHPRAHLRRFVLQPLSEIASDLVLPGQILTVRQLLDTLQSDETLRRFRPE